MMPGKENVRGFNNDRNDGDKVAVAIQRAKALNARLKLMKERNENYLAEQRADDEVEPTENF